MGIARKRLDRHRLAQGIAEQPYDDLLFAALSVTIVAKRPERVASALEIGAGHVIEE